MKYYDLFLPMITRKFLLDNREYNEETLMLASIFSYILPLSLLLSLAFIISENNPLTSVLSLILVFLNASAMILMLGQEFLALMYLIVYVGGISVLFLFVIMLLNLRYYENTKTNPATKTLSVLCASSVIMFLGTFMIFDEKIVIEDKILDIANTDNTEVAYIAQTLFAAPILLILLAIMLLLAIICCVRLTHRDN